MSKIEVTDEMVDRAVEHWVGSKESAANSSTVYRETMRKTLVAALNPPQIAVTNAMLDAGEHVWNTLPGSDHYRTQADAALDALLEPTSEMVDAGGRGIASECHSIKAAETAAEYAGRDIMDAYNEKAHWAQVLQLSRRKNRLRCPGCRCLSQLSLHRKASQHGD